ncbi:MAG: S-methyl-5-thioribose-1-phosphate isomerase [Clostridia bacterium]|jgi:methylthioribose-1-phosphate isomerase|nr:S-methyl-5-thioribose-1-phosphate isomerase [Clostridia bacterium]
MQETILPIEFKGDYIRLLDQTALPTETKFLEIRTLEQMYHSIKKLEVRGAPAIGIAAAYGLALSLNQFEGEPAAFFEELQKQKNYLAMARPTAVNLFWALDRIEKRALGLKDKSITEIKQALIDEAKQIEAEEEASCLAIGEDLLTLLEDGMGILTHCNAGGIATIRYGTALAPILLGQERGIRFKVYADETRPLLQGSRLTAWELLKAGVDVTLITDNMAGMVMSQGKIQAVIVGCDRIAANGDTANKIGTYSVAVLAKHHNIPVYIAAPTSTIDVSTPTGDEIVIEERSPEEVTCGFGKRTAPEGVKVYNPAFDVTPAELITAIVTNRGILYPPFSDSIGKLFGLK